MASFVIPSQLPRKNKDINRLTVPSNMINQDGTLRPHFDARNPAISCTPCVSLPDGGENGYMIQKPETALSSDIQQFSRKVFVGGLPPDISEDEIIASFQRFGSLTVNWPQKGEKKSTYPPKGYAFLIFEEEQSVQNLVAACFPHQSMLYLYVSSNSYKNKPVQVRPWNRADAQCVLENPANLDYRKTVFVGGVPRPLKAIELAALMNKQFENVSSVAIDTDPELHYPKGAARVTFSSHESYVNAINLRFVTLTLADIEKRVEIKPFVLGYQQCDDCRDQISGGRTGPFFCANVTCLKYYCEYCWARNHGTAALEYHKPVVKEWADRPRKLPYRWC